MFLLIFEADDPPYVSYKHWLVWFVDKTKIMKMIKTVQVQWSHNYILIKFSYYIAYNFLILDFKDRPCRYMYVYAHESVQL